jgi:TMEM175 potassium channel family protein
MAIKCRRMNLAQIKVEYLISFSDALFAFSITLMALSLELPNLHNHILEPQLTKLIGQELIPNIIHYVISFLVVGMYWIGYHRIFEYIKRTNLTLTWLNLVFLLFISLVAYFTGLLSTYSTYRIVVISFASVLAATGFISILMWWYATNNRRLVYENLDSDLVRYYLIRGLVPPLTFLLSIGVSFIDVQSALYFWIMMFPANFIVNKIHQRPHF